MNKASGTWDAWEGGEAYEDDSAMPAADIDSQPTPYQSRLPEIDKMLNLQTAKYANKVRHGAQYRAILKASKSQDWSQEWLRNAEMDLWYTHSNDSFPGGLSPTISYPNDNPQIQPDVSSSDSEGGGVKVDIDWDKEGVFNNSPYIKFDNDTSSDTSSAGDTKLQGLFEDHESRGDIEGGGHAKGDVEDISEVVNSALSSAVKNVQFDVVKPESTKKPIREDSTRHDGTSQSDGLAHVPKGPKKMKSSSSVRFADMEPSAVRSNKGGERKKTPSALEESPGGIVALKTQRRDNSRPSNMTVRSADNGWVEFREPGPTRTFPSVSKAGWDKESTFNFQRRLREDADAKKAAALSAWATFPAQAAKEDKADALAYKHPIPGSTTQAAPAIKETFKKIVITGDKFERKIVEKTVEILK
ncbi:hypothetical protein BKA65DRAFT_575777 [Rhexocercosporidium sp. MPI-PUGE-AT-0058]|nr:hypothetical protein BKA65DRAFT_575777 [Rhexocercosporidium sp. MPI-PUGE-AT-0058]